MRQSKFKEAIFGQAIYETYRYDVNYYWRRNILDRATIYKDLEDKLLWEDPNLNKRVDKIVKTLQSLQQQEQNLKTKGIGLTALSKGM
tara:strand:+ start:275 stop:538 length:264 start_codon:yes stop_codon:yes gene_type:complete